MYTCIPLVEDEYEDWSYRELFEKLTGEEITEENHISTDIVEWVFPPRENGEWIFREFFPIDAQFSRFINYEKEVYITHRKIEKDGKEVEVYDVIFFEQGFAFHYGPIYTDDTKWMKRLYFALNHFIYEKRWPRNE